MEKIGLVLGGGGSRGAYQVGAIKALAELGFKAEIVTGTSVGSINACIYAQQDLQMQEKVWKTITFRHVVKHKFKWKNKAKELFLKAPWQQGFELSPLKNLLKKCFDEQKIRTSPIKLGIVYTGPHSKYMPTTMEDVEEGQLADYVIASCSATPFLKAANLNGQTCTDGGFTDNLPVKMAIDMGATKIIAIKLMNGSRKRYDKKAAKVLTLKPSKSLGFFLNFDTPKLKEIMQLGYNDIIAQKEKIITFLNS